MMLIRKPLKSSFIWCVVQPKIEQDMYVDALCNTPNPIKRKPGSTKRFFFSKFLKMEEGKRKAEVSSSFIVSIPAKAT